MLRSDNEGMIATRIATIAIALFGVSVISAATGAAEAYTSGGLMSLVLHIQLSTYIHTTSFF